MQQFIATLVTALALVASAPAGADLVKFTLDGKAGTDLLPGNENPATTGGTGGLRPPSFLGPGGIILDTATNMLRLNLVWGSGYGFTDLTGLASAMHIHGPTASPAPMSFNEDAGVLIGLTGLPGFDPSPSRGGLVGTVELTAGQVTSLLEGRLYINVHTAANPGGEIRGTIVPEPGTLALVGGALLVLAVGRRRSR